MVGALSEGRILVVDDRPDRASALLKELENSPWQFDVQAEVDDLEAVLGPVSNYDCVLASADLARVSWASVRRAMRNFDVQVPVIVLAGERDLGSMRTALGLGATDFFVRPQERPGLLMRSIERAVHHRHLHRELRQSKEHLERVNGRLRHSLRILEQDQQAGRQVQMAMLPHGGLKLEEYWISHQIYTSLYLSGDFTDYFQVGDNNIVFFLADVSGHGSSSAFATVLLKNLFARKRSDFLRRSDRSICSPIKMLELANQELLELELNKYATMVVGVLDFRTHSLRYSIAGHLPHPILVDAEGARYLTGEGSPVGLMRDVVYREYTEKLPEKFILTVMSDGILELLDSGDLVEKEDELLSRVQGEPVRPSALAQRFGLGHVDQNALPDDVATLFISRGLD